MVSITKYLRDHPVLATLCTMVVVSVAILFLIFFIIKIYTRQGKEYPLPDLQGIPLSEVASYNDHNYEFVVMDCVYRRDVEDSTIIKTDPRPHMMVKSGRKVYLTISTSTPGNAMVPDLIDETLDNAIVKIKNAGFSVGEINYVESQYKNIVLEVSYKGRVVSDGSNIPMDSKLDLTVGQGITDTLQSEEDEVIEHNNW